MELGFLTYDQSYVRIAYNKFVECAFIILNFITNKYRDCLAAAHPLFLKKIFY